MDTEATSRTTANSLLIIQLETQGKNGFSGKDKEPNVGREALSRL